MNDCPNAHKNHNAHKKVSPETFSHRPSRPPLSRGQAGVVDSYGIELIHPVRHGRAQQSIGQKGRSNHRWIVGGKL